MELTYCIGRAYDGKDVKDPEMSEPRQSGEGLESTAKDEGPSPGRRCVSECSYWLVSLEHGAKSHFKGHLLLGSDIMGG